MIIGSPLLHVPISRWDGPDEAGTFLLPMPRGWRHLREREPEMTAFTEPTGLAALVSVVVEQDGQQWLHVSLSRHDRVPSYRDMCRVKRDFIGPRRKAIQLFVPETEHVSCHPYCLHLWCCLTADVLPDFTRGNGMI